MTLRRTSISARRPDRRRTLALEPLESRRMLSIFPGEVTGDDPRSVAIADLNSDGYMDIVLANAGDDVNDVSVLLGVGDGTFQPQLNQHYEEIHIPFDGSVALYDVNDDTHLDIVVLGTAGYGNVSVLLGRGDGTQLNGFTNLPDYAASDSDYLHYQIHLSDYGTGEMTKFWFMNDHDVPSPDSNGFFANVRIREAAAGSETDSGESRGPVLITEDGKHARPLEMTERPVMERDVYEQVPSIADALDVILTGCAPSSPEAADAVDRLFGSNRPQVNDLEDLVDNELLAELIAE